MNIQPIIITCPSREAMLEQTLRNFWATDWPKEIPPSIRVDTSTAERPQERQEQNALMALSIALGNPLADFILFMEDDLEFNAHLYHNLAHWKPLSRPQFGMASLYNPNVAPVMSVDNAHYSIADPNKVYGSQAYVLSRDCAEYVVAHWGEQIGMQDIKISRLAAKAGYPIFYHTPSLVQHVGRKSAWTTDDRFHQAADYDPKWRAQ